MEAQPNKSPQEKKPHAVEEAAIFGLRGDIGSFAENDEGDIALREAAQAIVEAKAVLKAVASQEVGPGVSMADMAARIKKAKETIATEEPKLKQLQMEVAKKRGYS